MKKAPRTLSSSLLKRRKRKEKDKETPSQKTKKKQHELRKTPTRYYYCAEKCLKQSLCVWVLAQLFCTYMYSSVMYDVDYYTFHERLVNAVNKLITFNACECVGVGRTACACVSDLVCVFRVLRWCWCICQCVRVYECGGKECHAYIFPPTIPFFRPPLPPSPFSNTDPLARPIQPTSNNKNNEQAAAAPLPQRVLSCFAVLIICGRRERRKAARKGDREKRRGEETITSSSLP